LRPADILTEFSDTEIAMLYFWAHFQAEDRHFEEYLKCKYYYLEKMRDHLRRMAWYTAEDNWNLAVDLLQKMMKFELSPFEVKIEGSVAWIKWGSVFYRDENGEKIFFDAGLRFLCFYKWKHALTISFEYQKENKLCIRQIQWEKWVRKELSFIRKYPEDILKAFLECFEGYEVSLVEWEKAYYDILGSFTDITLEWYKGGTIEHCAKLIRKDGPRIAGFYNQDFPSLDVWPVENGFRKISLKKQAEEGKG